MVMKHGRRAEDRTQVVETERGLVTIPSSSALNAMVRRGAEGCCMICRQSIGSHYGHKGTWLGCQDTTVASNAVFMLVPVILPATLDLKAPSHVNGQEVIQKVTERTQAAHNGRFGRTPVLYVAQVIPPDKAQAMPEKVWHVYQEIIKHRAKGIERRDLIKALRAGKHPGAVDSAIRRLKVDFQAIIAQPVTEGAVT